MYQANAAIILTYFETGGRLFRTVGDFCSFREFKGGFDTPYL